MFSKAILGRIVSTFFLGVRKNDSDLATPL